MTADVCLVAPKTLHKTLAMIPFEDLLSGQDLRSIGNNEALVRMIRNQEDFDKLFKYLFHNNRVVVMRTADAIEKITLSYPSYLTKYKNAILDLCYIAKNKELKWHLAQILTRLNLSEKENKLAWQLLSQWALDKTESKIVRVSCIQALYEIASRKKVFLKKFKLLVTVIKQENILSVNARIKRLDF